MYLRYGLEMYKDRFRSLQLPTANHVETGGLREALYVLSLVCHVLSHLFFCTFNPSPSRTDRVLCFSLLLQLSYYAPFVVRLHSSRMT
jgi:hypothetical protein